MANNTSLINALLLEREGYLRRGLAERVTEVERQLESLGYSIRESASITPSQETTSLTKPSRKRSRRGDY